MGAETRSSTYWLYDGELESISRDSTCHGGGARQRSRTVDCCLAVRLIVVHHHRQMAGRLVARRRFGRPSAFKAASKDLSEALISRRSLSSSSSRFFAASLARISDRRASVSLLAIVLSSIRNCVRRSARPGDEIDACLCRQSVARSLEKPGPRGSAANTSPRNLGNNPSFSSVFFREQDRCCRTIRFRDDQEAILLSIDVRRNDRKAVLPGKVVRFPVKVIDVAVITDHVSLQAVHGVRFVQHAWPLFASQRMSRAGQP